MLFHESEFAIISGMTGRWTDGRKNETIIVGEDNECALLQSNPNVVVRSVIVIIIIFINLFLPNRFLYSFFSYVRLIYYPM